MPKTKPYDGSSCSQVIPRADGAAHPQGWLGVVAVAYALATLGTASARAQNSEVVLHAFESAKSASSFVTGVIRDSAGNLYGTASAGGTTKWGVVYKLDASGHETLLHNFAGGADGASPNAVIRDSGGNLYGTTAYGGAGKAGVVYKLDASGKETVLYSFTGGVDGANPYAGVVLDSAGNLYGTTYRGGASKKGVVYKVDATGHETVLYNFKGGADGANPQAGVIGDSSGNLYGTTQHGGAANVGVVYKMNASGETVLHSFTGGSDGGQPYAGVILDSAGNLYGTTSVGGGSVSAGVVFKLDASGEETVLHSFTGGADGAYPYAGVILDSAGNLYGTTFGGGGAGAGTLYKVDASVETVLLNFTGSSTEGWNPYAGVIRDSGGNLYGTTEHGGPSNGGAVYKLDPTGQETTLCGCIIDGAQPYANVVRDSAGNLYGTTEYGGNQNAGTVYKRASNGKQTLLYSFTGGADGGNPSAAVIGDSAGNLYGTTSTGGITSGSCIFNGGGGVSHDCGVIYMLDASRKETVLYSFKGYPSDGSNPYAGLIRDSAGNLYGTTQLGGTYNQGTVYRLSATGEETVLYSFTGGVDGDFPYGGLIRDSVGNLYGTSSGNGSELSAGAVYKLDTTGHLTVLHTFTGGADGGNPYAGLIADSGGNLYGTTIRGGTANSGVVYKLDASGEIMLYNFTGGSDGGQPYGGLILDSGGNLYGTTYSGGTSGYGVVYKLDPSVNETVLYSFTGGSDGGQPYAGVILDSAGDLYGTTYNGGNGAGVLFELPGAASAP